MIDACFNFLSGIGGGGGGGGGEKSYGPDIPDTFHLIFALILSRSCPSNMINAIKFKIKES